MKFEEALKAMREGKKVTQNGILIYYLNQYYEIRQDDIFTGEVDYPVVFTGIDIMLNDWKVIDD